MTNICLIRHGETDWNSLGKIQGRTDIPLNSNGIRQAEQCRDYLKETSWDLIITSPLMRAKETAAIINESLNLPIVEMAEFIERSFGDAEGKTKEERQVLYPDMLYPNAEPYWELAERLKQGLADILQSYPQQKVLLVAHGAVIHTILRILSNEEITLDNTYLTNACISNIHYKDSKWAIKDYNIVTHLQV
ncbi:histidine phosphatase family protein [Niallia sp. FSL R7-0271]|uniref:histidine phosphatase family protein n=1 Tax=Niallia sp. FSL R7-0271 TaxID=2921678 RepID=UPI0030F66C69